MRHREVFLWCRGQGLNLRLGRFLSGTVNPVFSRVLSQASLGREQAELSRTLKRLPRRLLDTEIGDRALSGDKSFHFSLRLVEWDDRPIREALPVKLFSNPTQLEILVPNRGLT